MTSDNKRRSRNQELRVAKKYGGVAPRGSGAGPNSKGDVVCSGEFRVECKFTTNKSYKLSLEDLDKIFKETIGEEFPVFQVEFQGQRPYRRFVVLRDEDFSALLDELRKRRVGEW